LFDKNEKIQFVWRRLCRGQGLPKLRGPNFDLGNPASWLSPDYRE